VRKWAGMEPRVKSWVVAIAVSSITPSATLGTTF